MIESLVPAGVIVVKATAEWMWTEGLLPEEAAGVGPRTVEKRRRQFTAGRNCARLALATLGQENMAIPVGNLGEPRWPAGFVGSITHCEGYCAAAVAPRDKFASLGIDAENHAPLKPDVEEIVCTDEERQWIRSAAGAYPSHWATLIFSAKESLYKAWYPLTNRRLDFNEAEVEIDPRECSFTAQVSVRPLKDSGLEPVSFAGRFTITDEHVFTAVVVTAIT